MVAFPPGSASFETVANEPQTVTIKAASKENLARTTVLVSVAQSILVFFDRMVDIFRIQFSQLKKPGNLFNIARLDD
jgi:hypothetical protein